MSTAFIFDNVYIKHSSVRQCTQRDTILSTDFIFLSDNTAIVATGAHSGTLSIFLSPRNQHNHASPSPPPSPHRRTKSTPSHVSHNHPHPNISNLYRARSPSQKASATVSLSHALSESSSSPSPASDDYLPQSITISQSPDSSIHHHHHNNPIKSSFPSLNPPVSFSSLHFSRHATIFSQFSAPIVKVAFISFNACIPPNILLFALSNEGRLYKISPFDGYVLEQLDLAKIYPIQNMFLQCRSFQMINGHIVCITSSNTLLPVNMQSFQIMHPIKLPPSITHLPLIHNFDGILAILYIDPLMHLIVSPHLPFFSPISSNHCPTSHEPINTGRLPLAKTSVVKQLIVLDDTYCASTDEEIVLFDLRNMKLNVIGSMKVNGILKCELIDKYNLYIQTNDQIQVINLDSSGTITPLLNMNLAQPYDTIHLQRYPHEKDKTSQKQTIDLFASSCFSSVNISIDVLRYSLNKDLPSNDIQKVTICTDTPKLKDRSYATCVVPIDVDTFIFGFDNGSLASYKIDSTILTNDFSSEPTILCDHPVSNPISLLIPITNLSEDTFLACGTISGDVAIYDSNTLSQLFQTTLFATKVVNVVRLGAEERLSDLLRGSLVWIAQDGSVCLTTSTDPFELLFTIPGCNSSLAKFALRQNELLLFYKNGRVRLWDAQSYELRRSVSLGAGLDLLADKDWVQIESRPEISKTCIAPLFTGNHTFPPIISINLRQLINEISLTLPWKESNTSPSLPERKKQELFLNRLLNVAKFLLARVLTRDLDSELDASCNKQLGIVVGLDVPKIGLQSYPDCVTAVNFSSKHLESVWSLSSVASWTRLFTAVTLLGVFLNFPETDRFASEVIAFYALSLHEVLGHRFVEPDLIHATMFWLDESSDLQQSGRLCFGSILGRMSNRDIATLVESLHPLRQKLNVVPYLSDDIYNNSSDNDGHVISASMKRHVILMVGLIAAEKTNLVLEPVLKDMSFIISEFLKEKENKPIIHLREEDEDNEEDENYKDQAVAVELCWRGFTIWQNYTDPVELLERLFGLATGKSSSLLSSSSTTPKNASSPPPYLRNAARDASLQIASVNTPLFMNILSQHLVHSNDPQHRDETLRLVAFLVRKKPLVLLPYLVILVEAVVKSLGSSAASLKSSSHQATSILILNEFVNSYPSIDYNEPAQKLAVGTNDGKIIMYDVKAGTRLYILDGHSHKDGDRTGDIGSAVTALSFSPDGRRLVTTSLDQQKVIVWKVGTGGFALFSSLINTASNTIHNSGALLSTQNSSNATNGAKNVINLNLSSKAPTYEEPFRTLSFNVGDEAKMTRAATLEWVRFEWPAERTVRLRIRQSALTFSV